MRSVSSARRRIWLVTVSLFVCLSLSSTASAQGAKDHCKELNTPQLIKEDYLDKGNYKNAFPCLVRLIESGRYSKNAEVWKENIFPVINHCFANDIFKHSEYDLETLLWQVMTAPPNEDAAKAVAEFSWSNRIQSTVSQTLKRFSDPVALKIDPPSANVGKQTQKMLLVSYRNEADVELASITPNFSAEVDPSDMGSATVEGNKITVTGLKGGKRTGTLVVRDQERGLASEAQLMFSGKVSAKWLLAGLAVTGGTAAGASETDGTVSTALWVVSGAAAVATTVVLVQFLRGGSVPLLGEAVQDHSDDRVACSVVPGPLSLTFVVRF